jgi:hypothetical protein
MASTASTVYAVTPLLGVDLDSKSSTPAFKALTPALGSDGRKHVYARASEALASTDTVKIGAAGSASSDSGSAGFDCNTTGGVTAGMWFWARKTSLA